MELQWFQLKPPLKIVRVPNLFTIHVGSKITNSYTSRHTVVCRAAQEAGAQPREYIDRKKENAIFAPP